MSININRKDIVWSYIAQITNYGSGLILLPFILRKFSQSEIGLWYIFLSITSLALILDFGFLPNITRTVSYIYSGIQNLSKEGLPEDQKDFGIVNFNLLKSVIYVVKKVYLLITCILILLLTIGGSIYLKTVLLISNERLWIAFYIFSAATCLNLFYSYYDALLLGRGLFQKANKSITYSKTLYIIISLSCIYSGLGLLGIAISSLLSVFLNRYLYFKSFYDEETQLKLNNSYKENTKDIFIKIWYNAKKLGLVSIGSFFIFQINLLLAGRFFSLALVASLGLTIQLFNTLAGFSKLFFTTHMPRFSSLRITGDYTALKKDFLKSMKIGWAVYLLGAITIIALGSPLLTIIKSKAHLPVVTVLILFSIIYLMEITHGNCAIFLTTKNVVEFVPATLITGFFILISNLILLNFFHYGIESFAISTVAVQLCYNAWKWPWEVIKDLQLKIKDIL